MTKLVGFMAHDRATTQDKCDANAWQHVATPLTDNTDNGNIDHGPSEQEAAFFSNEQVNIILPQSTEQQDETDQSKILVLGKDP